MIQPLKRFDMSIKNQKIYIQTNRQTDRQTDRHTENVKVDKNIIFKFADKYLELVLLSFSRVVLVVVVVVVVVVGAVVVDVREDACLQRQLKDILLYI